MGKPEVTHDGTQWSNAGEDLIAIAAYDPAWPTLYAEEARAIRGAIGGETTFEIEHFGSTAVAGLAAKPVIDIMLITSDRCAWPRLIAPLETLGYAYWAGNPRTDRMFFVKGMPLMAKGERTTCTPKRLKMRQRLCSSGITCVVIRRKQKDTHS